MSTPTCTCQAVTHEDAPDTYMVYHCPLHAAALQMRTALEAFTDAHSDSGEYNYVSAEYGMRDLVKLARAAIIKAKGGRMSAPRVAASHSFVALLREMATPHATSIVADDGETRCGYCEWVLTTPDEDESADAGHNPDCQVMRARRLLANSAHLVDTKAKGDQR